MSLKPGDGVPRYIVAGVCLVALLYWAGDVRLYVWGGVGAEGGGRRGGWNCASPANAAGEAPSVQRWNSSACPFDTEGTWSIGLFRGASPLDLEPFQLSLPAELRRRAAPNPIITCATCAEAPGNFVADPFLYFHEDGTWYLFFESKSSTLNRGEILVVESRDEGLTWRYTGSALLEPWHLSYPFLFRWRGEVYMLPEGSGDGSLRLYKAEAFPLRWKFEAALLPDKQADSTLVEWEERWWMFTSPYEPRLGMRNLNIFYADSPLGPWQPHAKNPVMESDGLRGARMAGRVVPYNGTLLRFGQDCGPAYGHNVVAFRIDKLTPGEFSQTEVPFSVVMTAPGTAAWNGVRRHHVDAHQMKDGSWVVAMDGDNRR